MIETVIAASGLIHALESDATRTLPTLGRKCSDSVRAGNFASFLSPPLAFLLSLLSLGVCEKSQWAGLPSM